MWTPAWRCGRPSAPQEDAQHQLELEAARQLAAEAEARRQAEEQARQEAEQRAEEQASATRRLRKWWLVLVVVAVFAVCAAIWASSQQRKAEQQARIATSRQLSSQAINHLHDHLDLALLLSIEAYSSANTFEARNSLLNALEYNPRITTFLHGNNLGHPFFSPDGKTLALWGGCAKSEGNTCQQYETHLWDIPTRQPLGLIGHDSVNSMSFSRDSKILALYIQQGSRIEVKTLWNISTQRQLSPPLQGHIRILSPDGKTLASRKSGQCHHPMGCGDPTTAWPAIHYC